MQKNSDFKKFANDAFQMIIVKVGICSDCIIVKKTHCIFQKKEKKGIPIYISRSRDEKVMDAVS